MLIGGKVRERCLAGGPGMLVSDARSCAVHGDAYVWIASTRPPALVAPLRMLSIKEGIAEDAGDD